MFFVLLNWLWIGISAFLIGYAGISFLNKMVKSYVNSISMIVVFGLCLLAVYAEYFSLLHKVGILANAILLCCNLCILLFGRKGIWNILSEAVSRYPKGKKGILLGVIAAIIFGVILVVTASPIRHYDTWLYHAQSIRWIEEYGIVKGLGNLHNRFAYNSSVFPLQALFSMPYVFGQSMHSVNGFITVLLLVYSIVSMKCWDGKLFVSDFLRLALVVCFNLYSVYRYISATGSDTFAIGLFFYILIKVVSFIEEENDNDAEYAYLCIIGVFAVSVKLSVAMIVLLVYIPLCKLIVKKDWRKIGIYLFAGLGVILPFLIRNVLISGYLVYPYAAIDLFNVDWKMPEYTLVFDSKEIQAFGRGLRNVVEDFDCAFGEWFPIWMNGLSNIMKYMFWINVILIPISVIWGVWELVHKRGECCCIVFVIMANLLLWFWGAPSTRYGLPFMFLLPLYMLGIVLSKVKNHIRIEKIVVYLLALFVIGSNISLTKYACMQIKEDKISLKVPEDYVPCAYEEYILEGNIIYVPTETDQIGYFAFPSSPYRDMLKLIELRGESIKDGFRVKEEFKGAYIPNNGSIAESNVFAK